VAGDMNIPIFSRNSCIFGTDTLSVKMDHKIEELTKSIEKTLGEKQEYVEGKICENPLAYVAGAFVGGILVGLCDEQGKKLVHQSIIDVLSGLAKSMI
jgi:hypothetical protein